MSFDLRTREQKDKEKGLLLKKNILAAFRAQWVELKSIEYPYKGSHATTSVEDKGDKFLSPGSLSCY
jgi:hypothetical protein